MYQNLEDSELFQHFTITPRELELLDKKHGENKIGFAIMLKFLQFEGRFPNRLLEVPEKAVDYVCQQLAMSKNLYENYDLSGRNANKHIKQIRAFTGFRPHTNHDAIMIQQWLMKESWICQKTFENIAEMVSERYKLLKIEHPNPDRIERIINSVLSTSENELFAAITEKIPLKHRENIDKLLSGEFEDSSFTDVKGDPGKIGLESLLNELNKLKTLKEIVFHQSIPKNLSEKYLSQIKLRVSTESLYETKRHPDKIRYALISMYCYMRQREIIDSLVELLIGIIHRIGVNSEKRVEKELIAELKTVRGKHSILFSMANAALEKPNGIVKEVIFPTVSPDILKAIVKEYLATGAYQDKVYTIMRNSYSHHYRRAIPEILANLCFNSNNDIYQPVIQALELIRKFAKSKCQYYPTQEEVPLEGVIGKKWKDFVIVSKQDGEERIQRINYEIVVLKKLREKLRCKEIWVAGADHYKNPEEDLPADFNEQRLTYYKALKQPLEAMIFTSRLERQMRKAMSDLEIGMHDNEYVKILKKKKGWISLSPLKPKKEPKHLSQIKAEIGRRWGMTSLLDILKETDLRIGFSKIFKGTGVRENIPEKTLQRRIILCLYGLGTNTGLKRVSATSADETYQDLLYVRRRYIHRDTLRKAIQMVANDIFRIRLPHIWGEGTTSCASDSKKFEAWDQNLLTEWHNRYHGRGIMIYWHVEKNSVCIYSQLKSCSSSEVAAMIEGILRHCTDMEVKRNYVDTHGQNEVGFAFCRLLSFRLMPRLKNIYSQKLYLPHSDDVGRYQNLEPILRRPINWELIKQQYDQMIKYATALRLGTAKADAILKRFSRDNYQHPTYKALCELGKAEKTLFLCQYLHSPALRQEIHEGLNVVENWNSANNFVLYGKGGEISTNRTIDQEITMLSLHLLQISMVYVNTLMIQKVLSEKNWFDRMEIEDFRALNPLIYSHINPYGSFRLNMDERIPMI